MLESRRDLGPQKWCIESLEPPENLRVVVPRANLVWQRRDLKGRSRFDWQLVSCPRRQAREAAEPLRQHGESDGQLFLPTGGRRLESEEEATGAARRRRRRRGERREERLWVVAEPSETIEDACADVCRRPGPCNATCVTECDPALQLLRNQLRWWAKARKAWFPERASAHT